MVPLCPAALCKTLEKVLLQLICSTAGTVGHPPSPPPPLNSPSPSLRQKPIQALDRPVLAVLYWCPHSRNYLSLIIHGFYLGQETELSDNRDRVHLYL